MARDETPPFPRGGTWYDNQPIDISNIGGINLEGKEFVFEPNSPNDPVGADVSGRPVRVKIARNKSTIPLKPCLLARWRFNADSALQTAVDGYTYAVGDPAAGMIDEFLPAAGVPVNDLFYLVVEGPTIGTTVDSGLTTLAVGDRVVPGTGTSAVSADSGKIQKQDLTGATATLGGNILEAVGRADQAQAVVTSRTRVVMRRTF